MPESVVEDDGAVVAVVGPPGSGKTTYIAALIASISDRASLSGWGVASVEPATETTRVEYSRMRRELRAGSRFDLTAPLTGAERPMPLWFDCRIRNPDGAKLTSLAVPDLAGENFSSPTSIRQFAGYLKFSKGIVLLIDPFALPGAFDATADFARPALPPTTSPHETLGALAQALRGALRLPANRAIDIPLAIVISKSDVLPLVTHFRYMEFCRRQRSFGDDFLEVTHASAAIEDFILSLGPGGQALADRTREFSKRRWFLASAWGFTPSRNERVLGVEPKGCDAPLRWIWHEAGVLGTE